MAFNINEIKANLVQGGARPALFQVAITNPVDPIADLRTPFMIKASRLPEWEVGVIKVPYFGREINLAGTRKIGEWEVTVICDEDYAIRNAFERWSNAINSLEGNITQLGSGSPLLYKSQATITQYSKDGGPIRVYQFNGMWPSSISAMEMGWERGDEILEFSVTFQIDSYQVLDGPTGNAGGV